MITAEFIINKLNSAKALRDLNVWGINYAEMQVVKYRLYGYQRVNEGTKTNPKFVEYAEVEDEGIHKNITLPNIYETSDDARNELIKYINKKIAELDNHIAILKMRKYNDD